MFNMLNTLQIRWNEKHNLSIRLLPNTSLARWARLIGRLLLHNAAKPSRENEDGVLETRGTSINEIVIVKDIQTIV